MSKGKRATIRRLIREDPRAAILLQEILDRPPGLVPPLRLPADAARGNRTGTRKDATQRR